MARKFIIILREGQLTKRTLPAPQGPRKLHEWVRHAGHEAAGWRALHFLFCFGGKWRVFRRPIGQIAPQELKVFESQAAAEMYMLTKGLH